jgi:hypothetical protein
MTHRRLGRLVPQSMAHRVAGRAPGRSAARTKRPADSVITTRTSCAGVTADRRTRSAALYAANADRTRPAARARLRQGLFHVGKFPLPSRNTAISLPKATAKAASKPTPLAGASMPLTHFDTRRPRAHVPDEHDYRTHDQSRTWPSNERPAKSCRAGCASALVGARNLPGHHSWACGTRGSQARSTSVGDLLQPGRRAASAAGWRPHYIRGLRRPGRGKGAALPGRGRGYWPRRCLAEGPSTPCGHSWQSAGHRRLSCIAQPDGLSRWRYFALRCSSDNAPPR